MKPSDLTEDELTCSHCWDFGDPLKRPEARAVTRN